MTDTSRYDALEAVLMATGKPCGASEAHGIWSGLLSVDAKISEEKAVEALAEGFSTRVGDQIRLLIGFVSETRKALEDGLFSFDLLLPDDEVPLSQRAEALAQWCQGFLYGLGLGGERKWSEQALEILRDLQTITHLDPDAEGEEDEQAFTELVEYVRIGVQLLFTESTLAREKRRIDG